LSTGLKLLESLETFKLTPACEYSRLAKVHVHLLVNGGGLNIAVGALFQILERVMEAVFLEARWKRR
jgi:hypothetical protein